MRFSGGMLGLCVTMIAVMGVVLSGFALAVQAHDETTTAWTFKTDVTGLFDASQEPEYLEYSPAGNWTGFSGIENSISFTPSNTANKYAITGDRNQAGTSTVTIGDLGLSGTALQTPDFSKNEALFEQIDDSPEWQGTGTKDTYNAIYSSSHSTPTVSLLSDVISAMTLESGVDYLVITLTAGTGEIPAIIAPLTSWTQTKITLLSGGWAYYAWLDLSDWSAGRTIEVDVAQGTAVVYDADGQYLTNGPTSAMTIAYNFTGYNAYDGSSIADDISVVQYVTDPTIYIDSSEGLSLKAGQTSTWSSPKGLTDENYRYGTMEILFTTAGMDNTASNTLEIPLTDIYGDATGETLTITVKSDQGDISASASCGTRNDSALMGKWRTAILSIDALNGTITLIPVSQFSGDFNGSINRVGSVQTLDVMQSGRAFESITWSAGTSMKFGILSTSVYLDTYGYVLVDPYIDTQEYFPDLTDVRLNFYSFATYGESITINGETFKVDRSTGKINIPVTDDDGETTDDWQTLTNIYVSWAGGHTSVTFADTGVTRDLGITTTTAMSMSGVWYFTIALYEGSTVTQTVYEWNFESFLWDGNSAVIIFLAILAVGSAVAIRALGYNWLDYLVVICGGFMAFLLMGTGMFG